MIIQLTEKEDIMTFGKMIGDLYSFYNFMEGNHDYDEQRKLLDWLKESALSQLKKVSKERNE